MASGPRAISAPGASRPAGQRAVGATSWARLILRRFLRHRPAVAGLALLLALIAVAVFADQLAPWEPNRNDFRAVRAAPSAAHLLGADSLGRDVLSRLIAAARISLSVGLVAVSLYVAIGTVLGAVSGYYGGPVDAVIMRLTDMVLSFPSLILILLIVSVVGPSIYNVMVVLGLLGWPSIARIVRALFLSLRERDFVTAARCAGASDRRIIFRHVLPNTVGPILVAATFGVATAIIAEASLSFLGLGVQPPQASWGNMLAEAQSLTILEQMPWLWVPPGALIFCAVLAINFVGDGLRDAIDPASRR